ncbi:MmgE/PrpD family protein [Arthrobacter sp. NPDC056493]|uniref:MmgE/PrpD family protein n=1 Tax=Arthrobacter sp. NPDC056493 TaxID=3345839 RepID=UPI00366D1487
MRGTTDPHIEEAVAATIQQASWNSLPAEAKDQTVRALMWWTATALEGVTDPDQRRLMRYAASRRAEPEATVLGTALQTSAELAALLHGRAAKTWEHEDKYWADESIGPGVAYCVISAAVAAAEARSPVTGQDLGAAVACGVDLVVRMSRLLGMKFTVGHSTQHPSFILGTYGAAAAAGRIFGLDQERLVNALGLAHEHASGSFQTQIEGRGVALQGGLAARSGIESARLAEVGMQGPRASITGKAGLYATHYPHIEVSVDELLDGLGSGSLITEVAYKAYPCGVAAHPALDAVRSIRERVDLSQVDSISVKGPETLLIMAEPVELRRSPQTPVQAQFSIPWAVSAALRDGNVTIDHYTAAALSDPQLRALAERTTVLMSPQAKGTAVEIRLRDGSMVCSEPVVFAAGHPNNPLSTDEISLVFLEAANRAGVDEGQARRALRLLDDLESVTDVREFTRLLTVSHVDRRLQAPSLAGLEH